MKKRVPSFWWDYRWVKNKIFSIIVESNEPQYPLLAEFILHGEYADNEIEKAEKIIDDLNAGRLTLKQAIKEK